MARGGSGPKPLSAAGRGRTLFLQRYEALGEKVKPITLTPSLRHNPLRIPHEAFEKRMASLGVTLEKIPFARDGYWIKHSPFSLGAIAENLLGYYYLQEAAAQLPVQVLDPKPGETVLDMAASPGGKTTQIAQLMQNKGLIVALERKPHRLPALQINLERMGSMNAVAYCMDAYQAAQLPLKFDKILLDAPCSGNYVTDRDWFDKRTIPDIERSAKIQLALLSKAAKALKPGGTLVYSTCSLEPEENEANISALLEQDKTVYCEKIDLQIGDPGIDRPFGTQLDTAVRKCRRFWPHKTKTEGFFIAKLRKCT